VVKDGIELAKGIVPPGFSEIDKWRLAVSATLIALTLVITLHVAYVCGWPPFYEEAFANAADVKEILVAIKEEKIIDRQRDWCASPNGSSKDFFLARRNQLLREYRELTGQAYEGLPSCAELGIIQ